jgi:hypothetical protein
MWELPHVEGCHFQALHAGGCSDEIAAESDPVVAEPTSAIMSPGRRAMVSVARSTRKEARASAILRAVRQSIPPISSAIDTTLIGRGPSSDRGAADAR